MPIDLDKNIIIKDVGGSLIAFLFYGHIELASEVNALKTTVEQSKGELKDIWSKYNKGQTVFINHSMKEMDYKVKQAEKWEQFYKDKN